MSHEVFERELADVQAELDRQIAQVLRRCLGARKRTVDHVLETAARVEQLHAAKQTFAHFGHRAMRLSKGAEVAA